MAMQGARNHGGRSVIVRINAKTPQKKTSTQIETTIFSAAATPARFAVRSNSTSNKTLFHCFAMYSPGACPFSINCASHALYTWLARSPASMRRCHTQGIRSKTDRTTMRNLDCRKNRIASADCASLAAILTRRSPFCSVKFAPGDSTIEEPRFLRRFGDIIRFPGSAGGIVQTGLNYAFHARQILIGATRTAFRGALLFAVSLQIAQLARTQEPAPAAKCPPVARIDSAKDTYGSTVVADPYRWLEDQNSPETRAWIDAQQKCTEAALSNLPGRAQLIKRLSELFHTDTFEAPVERGGRYFFRKRLAGQDLRQLYIRRALSAPDEILIDPLPWSPDHSVSVTFENVSRDGKFVFYGRRDGGQDEITPRVLDVDAKQTLPDAFPKAQYFALEPTPDNRAVYYSMVTPEGPRAFVHRMGDDPAKDQMIFGKDLGKDKILLLQLSEDGNYLVYQVVFGSGSEQTEIYVQNVKENGPVVAAVSGQKSLFYPVFAGDHLFILSNWNAPEWHVFSTSLATPQREQWKEVVPETSVHLETIAASGGKLIGHYIHNGSSELKVFGADGKVQSSIPLPSLGTVGATLGRWESPELFFSFESYDSAPATFHYNVPEAKSEVWARDKVQIDSSAFQIEQV